MYNRSCGRSMMWGLLALTVLGSEFCTEGRAETFVVKKGEPQAQIIIAETPARKTKLAARELQSYIEKIAGATLAITHTQREHVQVKIYVGKSKYTDALNLSTDGLAHGAFRMVSGSDWLALLGPDQDFEPMEPWNRTFGGRHLAKKAWDELTGEQYGFPYTRLYSSYNHELDVWEQDDGGTLNAVYEFLRGLGVRWYFPGEIGEIVPTMESIPVPAVDKTVQPDFPMRRFTYWSYYEDKDHMLWNLRMGINFGHELMGLTQNCHGSKWVYMRDEIKESHPEWYALWDGKRATDHSYSGAPCLSSEGLFARHLKFARMMLDLRQEPMLSLDACDGYGRSMCECDLCEGKSTPERGGEGAMSDYVWNYVNRVAEELYKTHPDRKVSGLSYSAYKLPPQTIDKLSPNLALVLCQGRRGFHDRESRERVLGLRRDWLGKLPSGEMYIYDYYLNSRPRSPFVHIPVYVPRLIAEDLRSLKGLSMGDMIEVYRHPDPEKFTWHAMAVMHLNIYVTARLWWDADQDLDALLDEFYTMFYGPAHKEMKAFIEFCEANWPLMRTNVKPIDEALELLAVARKAAGDSMYGKRIDLVAEYVNPLHLLRKALAKARENVPRARALQRNMSGRTLDGNLEDETYWPKRIRVYSLYDVETGRMTGARGAQQPRTTFQVFWDGGDALHFGIRCSEPDMANLNITATQDGDTNLWSGDYVEILIETLTHSYYRIAVNPAGALVDVDMHDSETGNLAWSSGAKAAVQLGDDGWTAEIRVPWAGEMARAIDPLKGIDGRKPSPTYPWWINVCRQRVRDGKVQRAAWSPTGTNRFDDLSKFGSVYIK